MCQLSVVFITYNRKNELLRAINSCLSGLNENSEIIVVDNASTDGTNEMIKENFPDIKYFFSEKNLGVAGGRNKAFDLCSGEYAFFLDDDAVVASDSFFQNALEFMGAHSDVVAASFDVQEPLTGSNLNSEYQFYDKQTDLKYILSFCGCAHILRCDFFRRIELLYPDSLMFGSEELYASLNIWNAGGKIVQLDELKINHMPSRINRCDGKERDLNFIVNQYLIKKLKYPKSILWISKTFYEMHKMKNGLTSSEWKLKSKQLLTSRYDAKYRNPIKFGCWLRLLTRFGWRVVL